METFLVALNVILPTCLLVGVGVFLRKVGVIKDAACEGLNAISFRALLPCMVFNNIYGAKMGGTSFSLLLFFAGASFLVIFSVLLLIVPRIEKDGDKIGVMIQGSFHNSFIIIGMSLAIYLYPGSNYLTMAILTLLAVPLNNILSVLALKIFKKEKTDWKRIALSAVTNPMVIACIAAMLINLCMIRFPTPIESVISSLGGIATPLCLLAIGGGFKFGKSHSNLRQIFFPVTVKLLILPLIFIPISVLLGFRELALLALLVFFGSPTSPATHILAVNYHSDTELSAQIVLYSNCFTALSLFMFIYALLSMGYL